MAGTEEYVRQYGDISFEQLPFCDADNVALCEVFYMPLENVVSSDLNEPARNFSEVCESLFDYNGRQHKPLGLFISKNVSVRLMQMAASKRFSSMKIAGCTETFMQTPAVQFAAATFILPDGTLVIPFRGTDDTLAGWKEDLDMFVNAPIPSYKLAVDYIEKVAEVYDGNIILCGHSKGGHLALYTAVNCSEKVRSRITRVYNNDGPGYVSYSLFNTPAYREILPKYRHFVPQCSFVGMLMFHDDDYKIVKSNKPIGMLQHDLGTWQIEGCDLKQVPELTPLGKVQDLAIMELFSRLTKEQCMYVDKVVSDMVSATGQICLTGFAKTAVSSVSSMVKTWKKFDESTKEHAKAAFAGTGKLLMQAVDRVKKETAPSAAKRAADIAAATVAAV